MTTNFSDKESQIVQIKQSIQAGNLPELQRLAEKLYPELKREDFSNLALLASSFGNLEILIFLFAKGADVNFKEDEIKETCLHKCAMGTGSTLDCMKYLINKGAQVNAVDAQGSTPLHVAILNSNVELTEHLVASNANVNFQDSKGSTPLHLAVVENQVRSVQVLLQGKNIDPNIKNIDGSTPLHMAAFHGSLDSLKALLAHKKILIDDLDSGSSSPLHQACFNGHIEIVKLLLNSGAKINYDEKQSSPLHAAAFGGHTNCIELLIKQGADISSMDPELATPLHKAAFNGHVEAVRMLLDYGADLSAQDAEGCTPLHKAAFSGKHTVVSLLLERGAEVDCQDNEDGTPLHNACFTGQLECVKILLASQANFNCSDSHGASPLHLSVLNGHIEVTKFLVNKYGAQVDTTDDRGMTPMHYGIAHTICLEFLTEHGAQPDQQDNGGGTALLYAVKNECLESCRFLILKGADPNHADARGVTPLSIASVSTQNAISEALKEKELKLDSETQKMYQKAVKQFNKKAKEGIAFLKENNIMEGKPEEIARFLHTAQGLDKGVIGEYLGEGDAFNISVLGAFVERMDFSNLDLDDALRKFLVKFTLPGEAQKIDRMMERFAKRFVQNNPNVFPSEDTAYILSFSLIMLNTDAHNPQVKNKMTKEQFVKNNSGIANSKDLPREYLEGLYSRIVKNEIKMQTHGSIFQTAERKGWCRKQGGRVKSWKKRFLVLKDNCLYYFKKENDKNPYGIIPLENLHVREVKTKGQKNCFEVYSESGIIKSCKKKNNQLVEGHHDNFVIATETNQEMDAWISAIQSNIASNPLFEMIKKRKEQNLQQPKSNPRAMRSPSTSDRSIDFQELHDACLMCSMCYKTPNIIKDAYGITTVVGEDADKAIRYFIVPPTKGQLILALGGTPSESLLNQMVVEIHFGLDKIVSTIEQNHFKGMKKDTSIQIFAHGFGAAVALLLGQKLQSSGYRMDKIVSFGQPKTTRETELKLFANLPAFRVIDYHDPYFSLFPGYVHVGPEVILFEDTNYQHLPKHIDDQDVEQVPDNNHVEHYIRNLKHKLKGATMTEDRKSRRNLSKS